MVRRPKITIEGEREKAMHAAGLIASSRKLQKTGITIEGELEKAIHAAGLIASDSSPLQKTSENWGWKMITIEGELEKAIHAAGLIADCNFGSMQKVISSTVD
ncbi:hypothetical protein T484DRAFT_1783153 [Baffinella frigidus]|nr:hypothetical protein T484DRAFT_1783153 [Cryptophyta sp. CCMP2293]